MPPKRTAPGAFRFEGALVKILRRNCHSADKGNYLFSRHFARIQAWAAGQIIQVHADVIWTAQFLGDKFPAFAGVELRFGKDIALAVKRGPMGAGGQRGKCEQKVVQS